MAFCAGCGTEVSSDVAFCPKCGKSTSAGAAGAPATVDPAAAAAGIPENVAGLLCYVLGWLSGLIFFLIDKRPSIRFHAMQSMILFGALFVLQIVLSFGGIIGGILGFGIVSLLHSVLALAILVCWILCMVNAFQGKRFKVPIIGDMAENYSK
jgi:uncharacterized membrane protein